MIFQLSFLNALSPIVGVLLYVCSFFKVRRFNNSDILFTLSFVFLLFYHVLINESIYHIVSFRFYFGFLIFYFFFKKTKIININKIFIFLTIFIWLEFIIINTVIHPSLLPNFPDINNFSHYSENVLYNRPYSFGCNASVSSTIYLIVFILTSRKFKKIIPFTLFFLTFCLFASGTGFICFLLYMFIKKPFYISVFLLIFTFIITLEVEYAFRKLSLSYITFLYQNKLEQILLYFDNYTLFDYAFGNNKNVETMGGDFGWIYFILYYGISGLMLLTFFILKNLNRFNCIPILILAVSTFHYPTVFFFSGQVILGYLLNIKNSFYLKN